MTYPLDRIRAQFPILHQPVHGGQRLCYLDTAATAQKPDRVIDRLADFYRHHYGTVRRGAYSLSMEATALYEGVRRQAAAFLGAGDPHEIVFVRGTTEAMNLIAHGWGRPRLRAGDEVLVTHMEHHATIVPWHMACQATGATLRAVPLTDRGELDMDALRGMITPRTRVVSVVHVSNALGTVNPIADIAALAHAQGAILVVDGAQSAAHMPIDVHALGADFYACSGHKMYGPTGAGLLWGRAELLADMAPFQGGGEMIDHVDFDRVTWEAPPWRFEAGTPAFAELIGLGEALAWMEEVGRQALQQHDERMVHLTATRLREEVKGIRIIGEPRVRSGIVSFVLDGLHASDVGSILDQEGVCVRVGQHCTQPVLRHFGLHSTVRASMGAYTSPEDIDQLIRGLHTAQELLG